MSQTQATVVAPIRDDLAMQARMWRLIKAAPGAWLMEEFLVQVGIECHAQPLPVAYPQMTPKACFHNSAHLVRYRRELRYCEGYAMRLGFPVAVHHAWAIDRDDRVIDPTLREPELYQFLGYPLTLKERRKWINRHSHAVFDTSRGRNLRFMLSHRPELFDLIDEPYRAFVRSELGVVDDDESGKTI